MATIELTDTQRQVLRLEPDETIEVVDAATGDRYVLIRQEQFERIRFLVETERAQMVDSPVLPPNPCAPELPPAQIPVEEGPPRIRLKDLPTPPEVIEEARKSCKKYGWPRQRVEQELKLQYYFGGQEIYLVSTSDGPVVIPITERFKNIEGLRYVILTPEERLHDCLTVPSPWQDTVCVVGT